MQTLPPTWLLHHTLQLPGRPGRHAPVADLGLAPPVTAYLEAKHPAGLWEHQSAAIASSLRGEDVCVATPTASGKTTVFHAAALQRLATDPSARVLAIYPMKALGQEQAARWAAALEQAGIEGQVGRIDGGVPTSARAEVLRRSRVLIATPDVLHTWLLPRIGQRQHESVARFLRGLALVVIDEAHAYTGVFGSNSAFMFRRLQHAAGLLGATPRFAAASATMNDPAGHARALTGRPFSVVDGAVDSSPRQPVGITMTRPAEGVDFHTALEELLGSLRDEGKQFMAFFDSRKAAELVGAVMRRGEANASDEGFDFLEDAAILPFRAGYEAEHRATIQRRLSDGTLAGVLSTSALELGLDLPHLATVVLVGVPSSGTSLLQRIGRVGRSGPGRVIVIHSGTLADDLTFEHPEELLRKPLTESTVYLENRRIQYVHAMALSRIEGEHDRAAVAAGRPTAPVDSTAASWPEGFLDLCAQERAGQVPHDLQDMKRDAGDQPTHAFMLRDVEAQFEVVVKRGMNREALGHLSHSQVMREAYPGAVYYYGTRTFRVHHVDLRSRKVGVIPCPRYSTTAMPVRSRVSPSRKVHGGARLDQLVAAEADLQLWRAVLGFRERRGSHTENVAYPCTQPVQYSQATLSRNVFTSGVCLAHPALDARDVDLSILASLLLEAFLVVVPLERQDVDADADQLRSPWGPVAAERRFLCLFDQASGSLRLTGRLREVDVLRRVLAAMEDMITQRAAILVGSESRPVNAATRAALASMRQAASAEEQPLDLSFEASDETLVRVLMPTSRGTSASRVGDTFEVHKVFVHIAQGLSYRGVWIGSAGERTLATVPVHTIEPLPGLAKLGIYDAETDELRAEGAVAA
jgi:DEAD/DEAH box helicase domain-containing protein